MLLTNEEKHWDLFIKKLNIEYLNKDKRFNNEKKRQNNRDLLKIELQKRFKKFTYKEIEKKLSNTGIIFTKIAKTEDTISDAQTNLNNMFMPIHGEKISNLKVVSPPLNIKNTSRKKAKKAPKLGEHNKEILQELGYSIKKIKELKTKKIIL